MTTDREPDAVTANAGYATPEERFNAWLAQQESQAGRLKPGRRWKGLNWRNIVLLAISLAIWALFGWALFDVFRRVGSSIFGR